MKDKVLNTRYYQALIDRDTKYEGVFFVGVTTTDIFCRPTCPARKPKFKHCEFFENAQAALLASYRPCKRCQPLSHPQQVSNLVRTLMEAVEENPEKRWKDSDFENLSVDASTVRRQFKKRFGMTFVAYTRARRMGLALHHIRQGNQVIETQLDMGYDSSSGFREAFTKIMGAAPSTFYKQSVVIKAAWLDTPLGPMLALGDEEGLYLLEFLDRRGLKQEIERLQSKTKAVILPGKSKSLASIKRELDAYFEGSLQRFETPVHLMGTLFQKRVWIKLQQIPYGQTFSYADQARALGQDTAYRAVANANGANQLALIIPCHRIINKNGDLGGYGGGVHRKKWLINHERKFLFKND